MANENDIPQYAPSAPSSSGNCLGNSGANGLNIISPPSSGSGGGKDAEVLAGFSMQVDDFSDIDTDRFVVNYSPYAAVAVALSIVAKAIAVAKSNPILKGTTITDVECTWSYNAERDGDINSQSIVNTGAGADPSLLPADRAYDYDTLTITTDKTVTINGSDGRSSDNDVKSIIFGNYLATGVANPSMLFQLPSAAQAIFDALNIKTTKTSQAGHSFSAFGTDQEYMTIAHPAEWGESAFTKGSFTGGYKRIYSVTRAGSPLLVDEVLGGDTENQIIISNGNGFSEEFYFYQSEFPERSGNEPTIISKL